MYTLTFTSKDDALSALRDLIVNANPFAPAPLSVEGAQVWSDALDYARRFLDAQDGGQPL